VQNIDICNRQVRKYQLICLLDAKWLFFLSGMFLLRPMGGITLFSHAICWWERTTNQAEVLIGCPELKR
jgi:hypothetical protein